jgi:hypothetical protein
LCLAGVNRNPASRLTSVLSVEVLIFIEDVMQQKSIGWPFKPI